MDAMIIETLKQDADRSLVAIFVVMSAAPLQISYTLDDIDAAVHQLWQWAYPIRCFAFSGSMGAGKTTFIHALCDMLGVTDAVSSPTFALMNEYRFRDAGVEHIICHMDWYRLRDAAEAIDAGMEDALTNSDAYCFIEWPEQAPELIPGPYMSIRLEAVDEGTRTLTAIKHG